MSVNAQKAYDWTSDVAYTFSRPVAVTLVAMSKNKKITFVCVAILGIGTLCVAFVPGAHGIRTGIKVIYDKFDAMHKVFMSALIVSLYIAIAYKLRKDELIEGYIPQPQEKQKDDLFSTSVDNEQKPIQHQWQTLDKNFLKSLEGKGIFLHIQGGNGSKLQWPKDLIDRLPPGYYYQVGLGNGRLVTRMKENEYCDFCNHEAKNQKVVILVTELGVESNRQSFSVNDLQAKIPQHLPCHISMFCFGDDYDEMHRNNLKEIQNIRQALSL